MREGGTLVQSNKRMNVILLMMKKKKNNLVDYWVFIYTTETNVKRIKTTVYNMSRSVWSSVVAIES